MRVLSVVHDPAVTGGGGLFENVVVERGDHLDRWVVANGDAAPGDPTAWDAVMVFGGAMHPDQDAEHPWLRSEVSFIQQALDHGVPTIGVCLGAQLIARATGAWVGPADAAEVGWFTVELNEDGEADPVLGVIPGRVDAFQWHYYTFDLPASAVELTPRSSGACSTAGSSTARRSSRSRWPRSRPTPTATSRPGTSKGARSATPSSTTRGASARRAGLRGQLRVARPLVPGADVVARGVAHGGEHLHRQGRAASRVAVRDPLGPLGLADERLHRGSVARAEEKRDLDVPRAGNTAGSRVTGSGHFPR